MTLVMKFGGTSVGEAEAIRQAGSLVVDALPQAPLVVLSAMAGVTDALFGAARAAERGDADAIRNAQRELRERHRVCASELFDGRAPEALSTALDNVLDELRVLLRGVYLLRELTPRSLDAIVSTGERLSTHLFASYLDARDVPSEWFDARTVVRTDDRFGAGCPQTEVIARLTRGELAPRLAPGRAVVTQGYVGGTEDGLTTTLGRGGSDFSAALLGAALGAEEIQIWTDVEGILTCDPRVVPEAVPIREIRFDEAAELAAFGARVLHPATIQPAVDAGIPVTVRHARRPAGGFTTIRAEVPPRRAVTALASRGPITVVTVNSPRMLAQSGFLGKLFDVFGRLGISVDLVATAEVSVSLTVEPDSPIEELVREISTFASIEVAEERAIVAIVGNSFRNTPGLAHRVFGALAEINVEMISMGANEINLSLVVRRDDVPAALRALHTELFRKE